MSPDHNTRPSALFLRLFRWFCDPDIVEELEGDLLERFEIRVRKKGQRKAKWLFIKDVTQLFRPGLIRFLKETQKRNSLGMYKNYFKTARRNLLKQKMYSSIKIGGFALGIAACLLIALYIKDELSYDQHYQQKDRLYRVAQSYDFNDMASNQTWQPAPLAQAIRDDFPQVEIVGRARTLGDREVRIRRTGTVQNSIERGFTYADSTILELFEIDMQLGNPATALRESSSMIVSKAKAEKFFPGENPLGQQMILNGDEANPMTITGVMNPPKGKSHFDFDFMISLSNVEFFRGEANAWGANNYQTYLRLQPDVDPKALQTEMHDIAIKHILPFHKRIGNVNADAFVESLQYELQPVTDIHLYTSATRDPFQHGNVRFVWLFGAIAGLILLIAVVNFINLSTAKSANRAMEVGLRKAIGSQKGDLIIQFLIESVIFSIMSFILGVLLTSILLPYFNNMADKSLVLPLTEWWFVPGLAVSSLLIGTLAGIYPAFYLSSFRPIQVLKGSVSLGAKKSGLRGALVVFQFTTSVALIIATLVVSRQMNFIMNTELGFDKEQVITLSGTNTLGDRIPTLKNELLNLSGVENVTVSGYLPVAGTSRNDNLFWQAGRTQLDQGIGCQIWVGDHDYISTLGIDVIEGRDFSREMATDSSAIIINRQMVKDLGIVDPIGKKVTNDPGDRQVYTIVGIIDDFHFESLRGEVTGLGLVLGNNTGIMSVKVGTENVTAALASIEETWSRIAPEQPIAYDFLNARFARMYDDVSRTGNIFTSFAIFAIFVACLGLFALSVFMVEQRNKEISIRLVLGASMKHVLRSLGFNFLKPVLIALFIAMPIAWYIMRDWLNEFQYKTALSWDIFAIAGLTAIGIALLTISYQSLKAAVMKPVNGLRSE
ncbi:MAG: ABC transporter permease [Roseivirga sp.]